MKTANPKAVRHPEIPFDDIAVSFTVSTTALRGKRVTSLNLTTKLGRKLPDNTYEELPDVAYSESIINVAEEIPNNPELGIAFKKIKEAVVEYLTAKQA